MGWQKCTKQNRRKGTIQGYKDYENKETRLYDDNKQLRKTRVITLYVSIKLTAQYMSQNQKFEGYLI